MAFVLEELEMWKKRYETEIFRFETPLHLGNANEIILRVF